MKTIYNEGRVVGLSAYELYVKQLFSINPEANPMSEKEWLSSTLSSNCSMIIKIDAHTPKGVHDYQLPQNSQLAGATVVYASFFQGEAEVEPGEFWATSVRSYGPLISNTLAKHPMTPGMPLPSTDVPTACSTTDPGRWFNSDIDDQVRNYLKIKSGLILQPGQWEGNFDLVHLVDQDANNLIDEHSNNLSAMEREALERASKSLIPDLSKSAFLRLAITEDIDESVYIFLHGFTKKDFMTSEVSFFGSIDYRQPQNGDFLGPQAFPWACPVVMLVTTDMYSAMIGNLQAQIDFLNQNAIVVSSES